MKEELFENGPICATMKVYEDFLYYKSGKLVFKFYNNTPSSISVLVKSKTTFYYKLLS